MVKSVKEQVEGIESKYEALVEFLVDDLYDANGIDSGVELELLEEIRELKRNLGYEDEKESVEVKLGK